MQTERSDLTSSSVEEERGKQEEQHEEETQCSTRSTVTEVPLTALPSHLSVGDIHSG